MMFNVIIYITWINEDNCEILCTYGTNW